MPSPTAGRILSIQSHVAFGYVGGKAAVFPLQCLGYDVDVVNTVNFSNHSGYGRFGGSRATAAELAKMFELMELNGLLLCERLLTGYVPGAEALAAVKDLAIRMKQKNPELIYLLDPVLGDSGKLYVSPECIPIYREALQYSTVITPNWFEVEVLTDTKITDPASLRKALRVLHETYHVPNVVISSIPLKVWLRAALPSSAQPPHTTNTDADFLACIASSTEGTPGSEGGTAPSAVHARCIPCLPGYFSGVGRGRCSRRRPGRHQTVTTTARLSAHFQHSNYQHLKASPPLTSTAKPLGTSSLPRSAQSHLVRVSLRTNPFVWRWISVRSSLK
ncbi:hypothetical protein EVJ58_g10785 [Rhodofomes roseus]|uniref:pyridoxal kinase n=1 Tax=Rhodofomes roseus TaxID=34475 RepID=A0A4Y9XLP9_9APHY|nr:hypothetical protein EVJ58_g10785 [Rhodofomes roseus]